MEAKAWCFIPHSDKKGINIELEALPLVLCKNCKYRGTNYQGVWCQKGHNSSGKGWFCADGEEEEDADGKDTVSG